VRTTPQVKGIGDKLYDSIKDQVTVGGSTPAAAGADPRVWPV